MTNPRVQVIGLKELRRDLKRVEDPEGLVELREGLKAAARVVARDAQGRIPSRTGRGRGSVRATAGGNRAFVVGGKARVPYYGWLDFGSRRPRSGQARSVGPWAGSGAGPKRGRFIYPAIDANEREITRLIQHALNRALNRFDL